MTTRGPRPERILLTPEDAAQLQLWAHNASHSLAVRARIIWFAACGDSNAAIAERCGVARSTVVRWRARFARSGLVGLVDQPRPGRPRTVDVAVIEALFRAQDAHGGEAEQLSTRSMAAQLGISQSTVSRIQRRVSGDIWAWRVRADPLLGCAVREVVGLFVCPPGRAFVVSLDTAPTGIEPCGPRPAASPHAGWIASGDVATPRHRAFGLYTALQRSASDALAWPSQERARRLVAFLEALEVRVPAGLRIHVVTDDRSTYETEEVRRWVAARPRLVIHCTRTCAAWLLLAELWFSELSRCTDGRTARALNVGVRAWMRAYDHEPCPYTWIGPGERSSG
jgi:hypothetical protein